MSANRSFNPKAGLVRLESGTTVGWWPPDVHPESTALVQRAYRVVNPDLTGSAPGILNLAERDRAAVNADVNLSSQGKAAKAAGIARSRLQNLQSVAASVVDLEREYLVRERDAQRLPEPSVSDTLIDLAMAAHVRQADEGAVRLRLLSSDRAKLAIARTPAELSGLTADEQAKIRHSLLPESTAQALDDEARATAAARKAVQSVIEQLVGFSGEIERRELTALFGDSWKLPGAVSEADRMDRIREILGTAPAPGASPPEAA